VRERRDVVVAAVADCGHRSKRSFEEEIVPKLELGNEERSAGRSSGL